MPEIPENWVEMMCTAVKTVATGDPADSIYTSQLMTIGGISGGVGALILYALNVLPGLIKQGIAILRGKLGTNEEAAG